MKYSISAKTLSSAFEIAESCDLTKFAIAKDKNSYKILTSKNQISENTKILYSQFFDSGS